MRSEIDREILHCVPESRGFWLPSESYNERPAAQKTDTIVLHYTDLDLEHSLQFFLDPGREVSTHFLIGRGGILFQHVSVLHRAWHAGKSQLHGVPDVNSRSVGIDLEFISSMHRSYTKAQYDTLTRLVLQLRQHLPIRDDQILGHEHIAWPAGRKRDPGPAFLWKEWFSQAGIASTRPPVATSVRVDSGTLPGE